MLLLNQVLFQTLIKDQIAAEKLAVVKDQVILEEQAIVEDQATGLG